MELEQLKIETENFAERVRELISGLNQIHK